MSMEETLLRLYEQTTPSIRRRGRAWYPECGRRLREIAQETGCPYSHAAAVFAIVSPAAQLTSALDWTEEILRGERQGGRYPNAQGRRIERARATRYPVTRISGPKVNAFYRALMGSTDALVIDRWAAYAAGWDRSKHHIPRQLLREIEAAYRAAAAKVGETVRAFQAMLWILVRESTAKLRNGKPIVPKLADITE
jgi:hypothetical protein